MVSVCFYFQVHQPFRLRKFRIFDIGKQIGYFDEDKNREILNKVAGKCYLPMNALLLKLLHTHPKFRVSFSISGMAIEQFRLYNPAVLESFKQLVATGRVELIQETYYHSLASMYSQEEFKRQIEQHKQLIKRHFGVVPKVFRNTELIYSNALGSFIAGLGYEGMMAEGADKLLGHRTPNFIYHHPQLNGFKLLLKNYRLSDDIAFRFSNRDWKDFPLTVEKFSNWLSQANGNGHVVNLFMDYETFGEHQWEETGIFEFMEKLPARLLDHQDNEFVTPSEAIAKYPAMGEFDCHEIISWADVERDVSAWVGNEIQKAAVDYLFEITDAVLKTKAKQIIEDWRKLQTSDHFYYMCTKWFSDGDVHKYFNPYNSPYDAFINFMNILNDLILRVEQKLGKKLEGGRMPEFRLKLKNG
jgi:alpha-amylase